MSKLKPRYDLSTISQRDSQNICAEVLRNIFIEVIEGLQKETDDEKKKNMESVLQSLEHTIFVVEGNDDFIKFIMKGPEQVSDDPFEQ